MNHIPSLLVLAFTSSCMLTACAHKPRAESTTPPATPPASLTPSMPTMPSPLDALTRTPWHLTHIDGLPISLPLPAAADADTDPRFPSLSLDLAQSRIAGFSAVNRWSAPIDTAALKQGTFRLGITVATKMAGLPDRMQIEQRFFNALAATTRYDQAALTKDTLILLDATNTPRLQFTRAQSKSE